MKKITIISGTSRPDNYTVKAAKIVEKKLKERNIEIDLIDARELELNFPGHPETKDAKRMQESIKAADAVILATPEYHGSFSAMLKLILENMGFPSPIQKKPVALLGVAAGRIGAIKSLEQLRSVCAHMGAIVLPLGVSIAGVQAMFDENDNCTDANTEILLEELGDSLIKFMEEYIEPRQVLEAMVRSESLPWSTTV
jgi:NAD(P)H-dependent FMN reductase